MLDLYSKDSVLMSFVVCTSDKNGYVIMAYIADYGLNVEDPGEYNRVREEFHAVIRSQGCVLVLDNIDGLYRCKDTSDQMVGAVAKIGCFQ